MFLLGALGLRPGRSRSAVVDQVVVLLSGNDEPYREAAAAIKAGLPGIAVRVVSLPASPDDDAKAPLVAVGQKAAQQVADQGYDGPVLAAMLPGSTYQALLAGLAPSVRRRWSALVLDQPWERQFGLMRLLLPKARQVGLLYSNGYGNVLADARAKAAAVGLTLQASELADTRQLFPSLRQLLAKVEVLWALPDREVINRNTVEGYLMSAYRAGIPVIGYSRALVDAGALAGVYSTPGEIGRQAAEILARFLNDGAAQQTAIHLPRYFTVKVNYSVARSMELHIPTEADLKARLELGTDS